MTVGRTVQVNRFSSLTGGVPFLLVTTRTSPKSENDIHQQRPDTVA